MAAPTKFGPVILVPGFMGSELLYSDEPVRGTVLWVDKLKAATPAFITNLMLAPDGDAPLPDWGSNLVPGVGVAPYYTQWDDTLTEQGKTYKFGPVVSCFYDWRKDLTKTASQLVTLIQANSSRGNPCNVVAHSMGGLLARLAYALLVDAGETWRLRRLVTLGTPHAGSYDAVRTLAGTVTLWDSWVWNVLWGSPNIQLNTPYGRELSQGAFWCAVGGTWPALYQMLPAPDEVNGKDLADLLYTSVNYGRGKRVSQAWLDYARKTVWPRLQDPKYAVPSSSLWCLAGYGAPTMLKMKDLNPKSDWDEDFFKNSPYSTGDGVVLETSQYIAASNRWRCQAMHRDEPTGFATNQMIAQALTQDSSITTDPVPINKAVIASDQPSVIYDKLISQNPPPSSTIESGPLLKQNAGDP